MKVNSMSKCLLHFSTVILGLIGLGTAVCPDGFTAYEEGGLCYRVFLDKKNWTEARTTCRQYHADLAKEDDESSAKALQDLTTKASRYYWISLNDIVQENSFYWLDGTTLVNPKWDPSTKQPNGAEIQSCVVGKRDDHLWEDKDCSDSNSFVCEFNQGTTLEPLRNIGTNVKRGGIEQIHQHILSQLKSGSPEECARLCLNENACHLFTYDRSSASDVDCLLGFFGPATTPILSVNTITTYSITLRDFLKS